MKGLRKQTRQGDAGLLLARLGRMATRRLRAALAPVGLTTMHVAVLREVLDHGPTTQGALAATLDIDPGYLVAALNDLEADGLAIRRRDPSDRRRHIVEVSARGAARLAEAGRELAGAERLFLGDLEADDRRELRALLSRVAA